MKEDLESLGEWIRGVRTKSGLLQHELADLLGTSRELISKWEHNHSEPTASTLTLFECLECDPDTIVKILRSEKRMDLLGSRSTRPG